MKTKYVYWKESDWWIGYLEEYPDYLTQGSTLDELADNLKDIYFELTSVNIPSVRKTGILKLTITWLSIFLKYLANKRLKTFPTNFKFDITLQFNVNPAAKYYK